jgi:hypothetical protein
MPISAAVRLEVKGCWGLSEDWFNLPSLNAACEKRGVRKGGKYDG